MRLWSFFGEDQYRVLTQDEDAAALPPDFAPWVRFKTIILSDDDTAEMEAIRSKGYYLYRAGP